MISLYNLKSFSKVMFSAKYTGKLLQQNLITDTHKWRKTLKEKKKTSINLLFAFIQSLHNRV